MYRAILMVSGLFLVGCPGFGSKTLENLASETDEVTYYQHIEPILRERCVQCHSDPPRLGALNPLVTAEQVKNQSARIHTRSVVELTMPPGTPLDAEDRALIDTWYRSGAPLGTPPETELDAGDTVEADMFGDTAHDAGALSDAAEVPGIPTWNQDVAPIMNAGCAFEGCHGSDLNQGGLDLTSFSGFLAGGDSGDLTGGGDPAASAFIDRLRARNGKPLMPPSGALNESDITLIERWIEEGHPEE